MNKNLLNKLWLRVGMLVAIMTTALAGTAWAENETDVLTASLFAATTTTYTDFSGVSVPNGSSAVYAGNNAKTSSGGIQLRSKNSNSGIVSTTSGGKVKSVSITVESGSNTVDVYGSNTAYTAASDLYGDSKGTKLGSLSANGTVTVSGDYAYVGIRSNNGAIYLTNITIVWETGGAETCATPDISGIDYFLESTEVTITCETEGATIQYSTNNGSSWTNYSGPFTLTETTTVQAKATKTGLEESTASKTFTKGTVLTVAEAIAATPQSGTSDNVFIQGKVSAFYNTSIVGDGSNYRYYISDDGTTTNQLLVFRGNGLNNVPFSDADNLKVGDEIIILGGLTTFNNASEVAAGNYIVSLTRPTIAVEAPTFNPEAGTYTSAQSVTITCATEGATIYYTTNGDDPTTSSSVYSAPISVSETTTIKAIAVKGSDQSTVAEATYTITLPTTIAVARAQGTGNVFTQGVVTSVSGKTAYIQDASAAIVVYGSSNLSCVVGEEITVSGTLTTYKGLLEISNPTVNVISSGNTVTPSVKTIAEINSDYSGDNALQGMLVKIEGATVSAISSQNVTIAQGENTIEVRFGSSSDVTFNVGDELTLTGNIGCYDAAQIVNPTDVAVQQSTDPVINVTSENVELACDATSGEIEYTIDNPVEGTSLNATTEASWISNITVGDESVTFTTTANEGNADRTATITLSYTGAESVTVTVTQAHYVVDYATLPFSYDGNGAMLEDETGVTTHGLSAYNSSPAIKFDDDGDYFVIKINERPGTLTFNIKANPSSGVWTGTFKVQTSTNGETYIDVASYTELSTDVESKTINNLPADARYIKFIYSKTTGNVALGNINLAAYSTAPVINAENVSITSDATSGEIAYTITNPVDGVTLGATTDADWISNINVTENKVSFTTTANEGAERTATFTLTYTGAENKEVIVTQAAYIAPVTGNKYVKVTSTADLTDGQYLIVYEDGSVAFDGSLETLDAVGNTISVTINNNEIAVTTETTAAEFTIDVTAGTILSASGKYIGQASDANGLASSSESTYENAISIADGDANIVSGGAYLRYNSASNQTRFRYYKSSSYTGQKAIQLYKFVEATTPEPITVTLNVSGYATYASTEVLDFANAEGYTAWAVTAVNGTAITFSQITGAVPAGTGVLLKGTASTEYTLTTGTEGTAVTNLLVGITAATEVSANQYYGLKGAEFLKVNAGTVPAGKALLPASAVEGSDVKALTFVFEDDATGIENLNANVNLNDGAIYNLAGQRLQKMQKGINIVNGRKVMVK